MKNRIKRGPAPRINVRKVAEVLGETAIQVGESAIRNVHRLEAALLLYCLVLLTGWGAVRLTASGLPHDTGWGRNGLHVARAATRQQVQTVRPFRAINKPAILIDVGQSALQSE